MRSMMMLGAVLLTLSACSEGSVMEPAEVQFAKVKAQASGVPMTVLVGGAVTFRDAGPSNTGVGTCRAGGSWDNTSGGYVTTEGHPNCASVVGGTAMDVKVVAKLNGNAVNGSDGWFWYQKGRDLTSGNGFTTGVDGSGATWMLNLEQPLLNDRGNFMNRAGMVIMTCSTIGCHPAVLSW